MGREPMASASLKIQASPCGCLATARLKSTTGSIPLLLSRLRQLPPKKDPRFGSGVAPIRTVYRSLTSFASNPNHSYAGENKDMAANSGTADHRRLAL